MAEKGRGLARKRHDVLPDQEGVPVQAGAVVPDRSGIGREGDAGPLQGLHHHRQCPHDLGHREGQGRLVEDQRPQSCSFRTRKVNKIPLKYFEQSVVSNYPSFLAALVPAVGMIGPEDQSEQNSQKLY